MHVSVYNSNESTHISMELINRLCLRVWINLICNLKNKEKNVRKCLFVNLKEKWFNFENK